MQDLHTPQVLAALALVCTASMLLQPIQGLQKDMAAMTKGKHTWAPHGLLQLHLKRHTGRVRVESELYSLSQGGGIETDAAPQEVITAQLLAAHNVSRLGGLLHVLFSLAKWVKNTFVHKHHAGHSPCESSDGVFVSVVMLLLVTIVVSLTLVMSAVMA